MKEMILKMAQELGEDLLVWEWEFTDSVRISIDVNNFEGFDKNYHEIMREYDEEKVGAFYNWLEGNCNRAEGDFYRHFYFDDCEIIWGYTSYDI